MDWMRSSHNAIKKDLVFGFMITEKLWHRLHIGKSIADLVHSLRVGIIFLVWHYKSEYQLPQCNFYAQFPPQRSRWCGVEVIGEGFPTQVSSSSLDHDSKLRGPSSKAFE
ncbi:hypothetical protein TNCV_1593471 [Trichonephila clavipes]|nr:hypothetical protein TNCV_1593471 [Trichonephila clavipes]